jgi:hypothetical protein
MENRMRLGHQTPNRLHWPHLLGTSADQAIETIKAENKNLQVVKIPHVTYNIVII